MNKYKKSSFAYFNTLFGFECIHIITIASYFRKSEGIDFFNPKIKDYLPKNREQKDDFGSDFASLGIRLLGKLTVLIPYAQWIYLANDNIIQAVENSVLYREKIKEKNNQVSGNGHGLS